MIKDRTIQLHHRSLASAMIGHGMRASLIAAILDMSLAQARHLYEEITGRSSPSGQTPRSNDYYFAPVMRVHAASFLAFYRYLSRRIKEPREAFLAAYDQYHGMWRGPVRMPIDRAWRLLQLWRQNDGTIREARCSNAKCRAFILVQAHEAATGYRCPACQGSLETSRRLRGKSGRKRADPSGTHPPKGIARAVSAQASTSSAPKRPGVRADERTHLMV